MSDLVAEGVEIRVASKSDRLPLRRMLELYQHDLSDIWGQDLDSRGAYGYAIDAYWSSGLRMPFVFLVNGRYAGFALVDDDVCLPESDIWMGQFFVMRKYRRLGYGRAAAIEIFRAVQGR